MMLLTGAIGVVCLLIGYFIGENRVIDSRVSASLSNQDGVNAQLLDAQARLIDAELLARVQRDAANQLRNDLTALNSANQKLEEEVIFYKSLMSPSSLRKGLQVSELNIEPTGSAIKGGGVEYSFALLLTQVALRRTFIAGDVRVDVIGKGQDGEQVLSLTEISELDSYPLKFRFRFFQDLAGRFVIPEGFVPQRVLVTAQQKGKDPLQQDFAWPLTAETS
jgi:hypothetical protein